MIISDEFFQGFFDTDGSIQIAFRQKSKQKTLSCTIYFTITQSQKNQDILFAIQKQYGGQLLFKTRKSGTKECEYRSYITSKSGKQLQTLLNKNLPLVPTKRRTFLISQKIQSLLKKNAQKTKLGQMYLLYLVYHSSQDCLLRTPIDIWITKLQPTLKQQKNGKRLADSFFEIYIQSEVKDLTKMLPHMTLSNQYMIGAHCGDGSLFIIMSWNPTKQFINRPCWAITSISKPYLQAFLFTLKKGRIKTVGPKKKCFQYVLENVESCIKIVLPLFNNVWLPNSKLIQFQKFKQATLMLKCNYLQTEKDFQIFLNLVYDMSANSKRKYTKEKFLEWSKQHSKRVRSRKKKIRLYETWINSK